MSKNKKDKNKIAMKIIAAVLAAMMVIAFGATLIYYLVAA